MTDDHKKVRPFAESRVLTSMYGTEERFQAMVVEETAALESSELILDFLKEKAGELAKEAGGKALEWVSAELLKAFGLGGDTSDLDQIKSLLQTVLETQQEILGKLDELLLEVQFEHLITRSFDSVTRITNIYSQLQRLSSITGNEREGEAAKIRDGILDANFGAKANLDTLSDVLLGKDPLGHGQPLINLFVDRWFPVYTAKQLAADVPLSEYGGQLEAWLRGLFIIQYMGLAELANACIANGQFEMLALAVADTIKRMDQQKALLNEAIPAWTRTLPDALFDGRWYVVKGRYLVGGRIDDSNVMYGSPAAASYLDYTVQFRTRHPNNGDEEWAFQKTGQNDTFWMVERSRDNHVKLDKPPAPYRVIVGNPGAKLRLVMGVTNDPAVKPDAKRCDRYVPLIAFVDDPDRGLKSGTYLTWTRGGTNVVFTGSQDKAVRVEIVYSGH
jgi:hypothetical protein